MLSEEYVQRLAKALEYIDLAKTEIKKAQIGIARNSVRKATK